MEEIATGSSKSLEVVNKRKRTDNFGLLSDIELKNIFDFLAYEDVLLRVILVRKSFRKACLESIRYIEIDFSVGRPENLSFFPNLKRITLIGFDEKSLQEFLNLTSGDQRVLKEITVRECEIGKRFCHPNVETLNFDSCLSIPKESVLDCTKLKEICFLSCTFERDEDESIVSIQCPLLEKMKYDRCYNLTDIMMFTMLTNFHRYQMGAPTESIFDPISANKLSILVFNSCNEIRNPNIQSSTLTTLKLLNCQNIFRPVISCEKLSDLQIGWCENLSDILLACDNLKKIDLKGSGINLSCQRQMGRVQENINLLILYKRKPKWWNPFHILKEGKQSEFERKKNQYLRTRDGFLEDCENKKQQYYDERKDLNLDEDNIIHYMTEIKDEKDWLALSIIPNDSPIPNIRSMKIVIDCSGEEDIAYLLNSHFHIYHYRFYRFVIFNKCLETFDKKGQVELLDRGIMSIPEFNAKQYKTATRDYALFTIHHYTEHDLYALELWSDDNMSSEMIERFYKLLRSKVYFADKFFFHPISNVHHTNCPPKEVVPVCTDLFSSVKTQLLVRGECYGILRFYKQGRKFEFPENSIVVCESIPLDITPVSGIISSVIQTPLCHLTLLCSNRKTPNITLVDSYLSLRKYEDKWMRMEVTGKEYTLEESDEENYQKWVREHAANNQRPRIHLEDPHPYVDIIRFDKGVSKEVGKDLKNTIGAKAQVLMRIKRIDLRGRKFEKKELITLPGFALPFGMFLEYKKLILLEEGVIEEEGVNIVELMKKRPFRNEKVIEEMWTLIDKEFFPQFQNRKVILRSSTNVEDIKGFNGAGLYDSLSCTPNEGNYREVISKTITDIYCSLYTQRAVKEREYFNIDESNIAMAILVMPFIKSPVNGVVLSCNPYGKNYPTYFVNVSKDGILVTDTTGSIPEQWMLFNTGDVLPSFQIVSRMKKSSGSEEEKIICPDDVLLRIYNMVNILKRIFQREMGWLDIEFLVTEEGKVVVLQCRPYTGHPGELLH